MKKIVLVACAVAMLSSFAPADTVTSVNVVGVFNVTVEAGVSNALTFIGVPMTKLPVARGQVLSSTASTLTGNGVTWDSNAFAPGGGAAGENGVSTYYVEITSGAMEGRHFYITANDTTTLTLATTELGGGVADGQNFKIIPANRVRDVFGEPGSADIKLRGGSTSADADSLRVWDNSQGKWSSPIFYQNAGRNPANAWLQGGVAANDLVIDRDVGVLVQTLGAAGRDDVKIAVLGEVSGNDQSIVLESGAALLGGMVAVDTPIGQAGLEPPVLEGGSTSADADSILYWDVAQGKWSTPVFFQNEGRNPANAWLQSGVIVNQTFILKAGQAYFFRLAPGTDGNLWNRPSPLK